MQWFKTVKATPEKVSEAMKYYYAELEEAKKETNLKNFTMLQQGVATISSYFEQRLDQRCDIDAIYNLFENQVKRKRAEITQRILVKYPRALNSSDLKMFVDGDNDMIVLADMLNELNFIRAKYDAVLKSFEVAQWQLTNLVKLQCAGLDGALMPM